MDIVVVGDGVSAILLAESLSQHGGFRSLRIVGPGRPLRAHRLSYWSPVPTPFDAHAEASWRALRVVGPDGVEARTDLVGNVYRTFRGNEWLAAARARLARNPSVEWISGRAGRVTTVGDRALVPVGGDTIDADLVFSSTRPPGSEPSCHQRFEGWELEVEHGLEADVATLLDFRTPAEGDFRFLYALPLGPSRLFVEHVSYQPCDHAGPLTAYLRDVLRLRHWTVVDRERGATPIFHAAPQRRRGRVFHIGVAAGLAKPVTGYALTRMWRDAQSIAGSLAVHGDTPAPTRPAFLYRLADRFFVDEVQRAPHRLAELVPALFRGAPGDAVLGFLDDRARPLEQMEVALATPRWLRWWVQP